VHEEVKQTKTRSGWPVSRTLQALGVARSSYYRWLREKPWSRKEPGELVRVVQAFEALAREKRAVGTMPWRIRRCVIGSCRGG